MQLTGTLLLPFVVEMETLLLSALFSPLNERLCIPQLNVIQVRMPVSAVQGQHQSDRHQRDGEACAVSALAKNGSA